MTQSPHVPWWKTAVIYQIYPRSFADSTGDGVGDLGGVTSRLGHLRDLGVDGLWLSPFYRSPMADFGYDISDHTDVDPVFGTLADADALVAAAHDLDLRVVVDFVPNHTSDQHPWFVDARSSRSADHREFYVWRDPAPDGGPPNNWRAAFSDSPAWTFDEATGQYYLHLFLPEQPDVDWNNPAAAEAMLDVLRFWLDRGVDGFRADVIQCIGKTADLPDAPPEMDGLPAVLLDFGEDTHRHIRSIRQLLDSYDGDRFVVGETSVLDRARMVSYLGDDDELNLAFNFLALYSTWDADVWRTELAESYALHDAAGAWPTWVLSNHDLMRHRSRYGSEARARAAAVMLLTVRGTPFLYQGEEIGLADAVIPEDRVVDPGGRDGCRAPVPWTAERSHGWGADPWLPFPPEAGRLNVATQTGDPASMLEHYRRLIDLRRATPALHGGEIELLEAPDGVLRYRRFTDDRSGDTVEIAINFTDRPIDDAITDGRWLGGTTLRAVAGTTLGPDEARIVAVDG